MPSDTKTKPNASIETQSKGGAFVQSSDSKFKTDEKKNRITATVLVSLVVLATIVAYSPVLFDFFLGDDFVHLTWLKDAVKNPELIWRNFHSSWLDGTTTRFYRPLISVFMVTDYLGWGTNGLGFHITNLLFHLTATVFVFFISNNLLGQVRAKQETTGPDWDRRRLAGTWLYPLGAALLFGLYPLHCESVSWITGRVDAVVTAFYTLTFYSYLRWRQNGNALWFTSTAVAFALGLLSKEMALTLPPAFLLYEVLIGPNSILSKKAEVGSSMLKNFVAWAWNIVKPTAFFWFMVVAYFGVRRYALGTFVGGYDDSLFFIADIKHFLLSWLHGLRMFLVPLNKNLMGAHHFVTRGWEIMLGASALMIAINMFKERGLFRLFVFNVIFLGFCFAPVYKIFNIADDLQGARLAHVATVALSFLLAMAFILPLKQKRSDVVKVLPQSDSMVLGTVVRTALCLAFASISAMALWNNNQAWARAGMESNAIRSGLSKLYKQIDGDPQVLLIGLPDTIDGAYICRNALWGMTKFPQMERDALNCLMLNRYEQILPFGYLKDSLYQSRDGVKVFFWNTSTKNFSPIEITRESLPKTSWSGAEIKNLIEIEKGEATWAPSGHLEVTGDGSRHGNPELLLDFGKHSCFDIEFVALKLRNLDTTGATSASLRNEGVDLLYTNDISPKFDLPNRTHADLTDAPSQYVVLSLRSLPEWSLGGTAHPFKLKLPRSCKLAIDSIEVVSKEKLIPAISFENSGYMGSKGYLHLSQEDRMMNVSLDATKVPGAKGVILEVTRPNLLFETQNTATPSKVADDSHKLELKGTVSGVIQLKREMFPATGMYELRPQAIDEKGNRLGVVGDHIVISVDS